MSQINFEDETLDASDGVTRLLLAAEYWKEKATTLRAELEKAKSVPMKYRRMEFNAQLQNENTRLRAKLDALKAQEPVAWMKDQWSPDCGNYWELCREDEMGWRDRKDWVPLYARPVPAQSVPWVSVSRCLPNPEEHPRVLIYTEEYAFDGEQVFDVRAESLNERFFTHPDEQPEVCRVASHWMPHPANTNLTAAPKLEESK